MTNVTDPERGRRCCGWGHENLPAAALGIYDDGEEAEADVPYCADCAQAMIQAGFDRVTTALDPSSRRSQVCPQCGGSGRQLAHLATCPAGRLDAVVSDLSALMTAFDDASPAQMTPLFYAHAYHELRLALEQFLGLLPPAPSTRVDTRSEAQRGQGETAEAPGVP